MHREQRLQHRGRDPAVQGRLPDGVGEPVAELLPAGLRPQAPAPRHELQGGHARRHVQAEDVHADHQNAGIRGPGRLVLRDEEEQNIQQHLQAGRRR